MGASNSAAQTAAKDEQAALARIETELAILTRTLEGLTRRSQIYRDLDRASYLLARTLKADGPASINTLAARLGLDATTVSRQVTTMESEDLVHRHVDPHDARVSRIELSDLGEQRMHEVRNARASRIAQLLREWPDENRTAFGQLLADFNAAINTKA